jgi:hypothetical protein
MIKSTYKPGKYINPYKNNNKNNYHQYYLFGKLVYKGYYKNGNYIGYEEYYWSSDNKGIKYKI